MCVLCLFLCPSYHYNCIYLSWCKGGHYKFTWILPLGLLFSLSFSVVLGFIFSNTVLCFYSLFIELLGVQESSVFHFFQEFQLSFWVLKETLNRVMFLYFFSPPNPCFLIVEKCSQLESLNIQILEFSMLISCLWTRGLSYDQMIQIWNPNSFHLEELCFRTNEYTAGFNRSSFHSAPLLIYV